MTICKECGGEILWTKQDGRWRCFDKGTTTDHWDECSKRRWAQVKVTGERFENDVESGYENSIHGTKFDMRSAGRIKGANYRPTGLCKQCVPAWEVCSGCPDAF